MTGPLHAHEPSPEFRAHLEWQLETAMRRESRLAEPVTAAGPQAWARTLLIILVALAAGGAAGVASERVQDATTRNQLVQNANGERALLKTRVELAREELNDAKRRYEVGAAGTEVLVEAQRRVSAAEGALARLDVDLQEIQKTSAPPRDELNAPLVDKEDFVRKRLRLELAAAERELSGAETVANRAKSSFEVGLGTQAELVRAQNDLAVARHRMMQLQLRLELREKYVSQQVTAEQLAAQVRRAELTLEADLTRQQLAWAKARLDNLRSLVEIGTMSPLDAKRAEVELLELEAKFKRVQQQLSALGKKDE